MVNEFNENYDCPFTPMHGMPIMSGYIPESMEADTMFNRFPNAGKPAQAPGGTTAVPPYPTPQAIQGMQQAQSMQGMEDQSFEMVPGAPVQQDINYTQGFLRTQIGKRMLVSFLIGTNTYQDRTGVLERVGISYIILREPEGTQLLCDIYSIKFVRIFTEQGQSQR